MAVNWGLGVRQQSPIDAFRAAFEQGQERKRETEARNALSAYAQNPNEQGLNALAQFAPEFAIQERGRLAQQQQAAVEQQRAEVTRRLEMISRVAAVADTPEKWDAGVDYLAQFYPDLAEYKGKFTPQAREAAIAAAGNVDKYLERMQPVNLGPGSRLVDPNSGKVIAEAPFAPRAVTLNPGQMAVEYAPGGTGMDTETIFGRMIHTESRGRQFGANGQPLTSPAGAIGIAQVMPGTAPEAAQLAGLPFDENRYRTDPEYNAALGKAYFEKQLADFGDPEMAVAAYNAGPGRVQAAVRRGGENWKQYLPAETKGYLQSVFGGGTGRVIGRGEPKPDNSRNPPAGYRWKSDGTLEPIPGGPQDKKGQQDAAYSQSAIDAFDRAIGSAERLLSHPGFTTSVGVKGLSGGLLGGWVVPGTDAADFNAELDAMKAQVFLPMVQSMKGMGALSNAEGQKLTDAIGALDTKMSEGAFKASLGRIIRDLKAYRDRGKPRQEAAPAQTRARPAGNQRLRYNPATGKLENAN